MAYITAALCLTLLLVACAPAAPPPPTAAPPPPTEAAKPAPPPPTVAAKPAAEQPPAPKAAPGQPPAAKAAASPAAKPGAAFQQLLEAARKETKLTVWIATPNLEQTQRALVTTFKQRYGLNQLEVEWVPLIQNEANQRVRTEASANRFEVDVVSADPGFLIPVDEAGLVAPYDWAGTFREEFPAIEESVSRIIPEQRDKMLAHWDVINVFMYDKNVVQKERIPKKIEDLADPQWDRKVVINSGNGSPFDTIALGLGRDQTLEALKKIVANHPIYSRNPVAVISDVVAGLGPLGIAYTSGVETQKAKGASVEWAPLSQELIPVRPFGLYVPKNAPHPNVARLFMAWMVTDGMKLQEENEFIGRVSDPNHGPGKTLRGMMQPNPRVVEPKSLNEARTVTELSSTFLSVITATQRP